LQGDERTTRHYTNCEKRIKESTDADLPSRPECLTGRDATLSLPPLPLAILQQQVFEKLSIIGRPLVLVTTLSQTVHGLSASLEKRNQLIEEFKAKSPLPDDVLVPLYFGLPQKGGHVDENYPNSVHAIYNQTDDGIFFSDLLGKDLIKYGKVLAATFKKQFGKGAPSINQPDFTKADKEGLMPDTRNYADWTTMFVKRETGQGPAA
jgi:hypothetical protein